MDVVHPRCAGVDVSKRDAKVCVRIADTGRAKAASTVTTWGSVTNQVLALRDHLIAEQVTRHERYDHGEALARSEVGSGGLNAEPVRRVDRRQGNPPALD